MGGDAATAGVLSGGSSTGGSATGGSNRGGSTQGGSPTTGGSNASGGNGGSGASGAEASGEGGAAAGAAGSSALGGTYAAGSGGRAGASGTSGTTGAAPTCDPTDGKLDATPYPDCAPRDASDPCEVCIEASCCEEAKVCYGYDPGNVCGWGGPSSGIYANLNEIDCFIACVRDYVETNGAYDDAADDRCVPECTTEACGLIGNATQDLVVCLRANCEDDCFVP